MPFFSPFALKSSLPLSQSGALLVATHRKAIAKSLEGKDSRLVVVLGPCSLHHNDSAIAYAKNIYALQKKVEDTCLLVMRAHVEKPRTYLGWKGLLHDPDLKGEENLAKGIVVSRRLLRDLVLEGVPLACEFLDPLASCYFTDLISWGFIGARTSSSQTHRQLASSLLMPIGFKNSTDGSWESALLGALVANHTHSFLHINEEGLLTQVASRGNPCTHLVLRGSDAQPNYDEKTIREVLKASEKQGLSKRILIDCSHGNSQYDPLRQIEVFHSVLSQYAGNKTKILGMMLESHIEGGKQPFSPLNNDPYISITDSCLDWHTTEELVLTAHAILSNTALVHC